MSSEKTTNLGLHKWIGSDYVLREEFVQNFDKIDDEIFKRSLIGHNHDERYIKLGDASKVASGVWSDTTTVVAAGGTYTKTIPLPITAVRGMIFAGVSTDESGVEIHFDIDNKIALCEYGSTYFHIPDGSGNWIKTPFDGIRTTSNLEMADVIFTGTELKITFINNTTESKTLCVSKLWWEVSS